MTIEQASLASLTGKIFDVSDRDGYCPTGGRSLEPLPHVNDVLKDLGTIRFAQKEEPEHRAF